LPETAVVSLALAASFLVTPYMWTYEHGMLFIPWLWVFTQLKSRRVAQISLILIAFVLPWLLFGAAVVRLQESLSFILPVVTIILLLFTQNRTDYSVT
jgi:hypothetical protein